MRLRWETEDWREQVVGWRWAVTAWAGGFGQVLQSGFKTRREAKQWLEENAVKKGER